MLGFLLSFYAPGYNKTGCRAECLLYFSLPSEDICREIDVTNATWRPSDSQSPVDALIFLTHWTQLCERLDRFPWLPAFCFLESFGSYCTFRFSHQGETISFFFFKGQFLLSYHRSSTQFWLKLLCIVSVLILTTMCLSTNDTPGFEDSTIKNVKCLSTCSKLITW